MTGDEQRGTGPERTSSNPGRRAFLAAVAGLVITGTAGCTGDDGTSQDPTPTEGNERGGSGGGTADPDDGADGTETGEAMGETGGTTSGTPPDNLAAWRTMELTDVRSDETFTIRELDGPVVIQSFAVWCPKCERQSNNIAELDDSVARVSLNTDPNEDASKVADHAVDNGFDWRFAVAPTDLTEELKDEFGVSVTVAPSTPIIVACEGGGATFDSGSILSASEIESMVNDC